MSEAPDAYTRWFVGMVGCLMLMIVTAAIVGLVRLVQEEPLHTARMAAVLIAAAVVPYAIGTLLWRWGILYRRDDA